MSKKHLIITIAACALCLGIGVVIGMGISQNNLTATGANQTEVTDESENLPTAEDLAAMEPADLEIALKDYSDRLRVMEERQEAAKQMIAEIDGLRYAYNWVVTDGLYKNMHFLGDAYYDMTFEYWCIISFRYFYNFPYKPGTSLSYEYAYILKVEARYALEFLDEAAADYQTAIDGIKKALSDKGIKY